MGGGNDEEALVELEEIDEDLLAFQQDGVISDALAKGVDLRDYAEQIARQLKQVENASVADYVSHSPLIVDLYAQIESTDNVLANMQETLLGFQADLGGISDEIRHLQDESLSMNIKLKNRRDTEEKMHQFLEQVVVPSSLSQQIDQTTASSSELTEEFVTALRLLHDKLTFARMKQPHPSSLGVVPSDTMAVRDVKEQLEQLKDKAARRIREFFYAKINELKRPKTNVQIVQQNVLIRMKYCMTFVAENAKDVAREFRELYVEAMSKIVLNVFSAYHLSLSKFHEEIASRNDLIAVEEQSLKGMFSSRVNVNKRMDVFSLGDRKDILTNVSLPPIIVHVAQAEGLKYPYEAIFRSIQQHLMNAATSEFFFLVEFFPSSLFSPKEIFQQIFAKTLSLCLEKLENYLANCYDGIGLLLMSKITYGQRLVMETRRVPVLDSYFDRVSMLLWPRYKVVFDMNAKSIREAKIKKMGAIDNHPHYITRRYAEFAASVLLLQSYASSTHGVPNSTGAEEMIINNLSLLRQEVVNLLSRLATSRTATKPASSKQKLEEIVFYINNYDQILCLFHERGITSDETVKFEELLSEKRHNFVEEALRLSYGKLISFVQDTEMEMSQSLSEGKESFKVDPEKVGKIVREFSLSWKKGIQEINSDVMAYFSDFRNGMEILKQALTQLLLYYTRFIELIKKTWSRPPAFSNEIVTTQDILYEIKKYSRSF